ncbi:MAG: peptide deformylase [Pirellulales bacterium]
MLSIIQYPHPTLRHKAKSLRRVDAELQSIVREMFELMYKAKGVGLAATQVDLPYRLFVANLSSDPGHPEEEQVFLNPVISKPRGLETAEEGCLSLPGLYGDVKRPERVTIDAYNLSGEHIQGEVSGLLARVIQHETDHLDGVLFIDRISPTGRLVVKHILEEFEINFEGRRERGELPDDAANLARLQELEKQRC